jgi:hypothetical protein
MGPLTATAPSSPRQTATFSARNLRAPTTRTIAVRVTDDGGLTPPTRRPSRWSGTSPGSSSRSTTRRLQRSQGRPGRARAVQPRRLPGLGDLHPGHPWLEPVACDPTQEDASKRPCRRRAACCSTPPQRPLRLRVEDQRRLGRHLPAAGPRAGRRHYPYCQISLHPVTARPRHHESPTGPNARLRPDAGAPYPESSGMSAVLRLLLLRCMSVLA